MIAQTYPSHDFTVRVDVRSPRPRLCARCALNDHTRMHTQMGCTMPVLRPPEDWICACDVVTVIEVSR